MKNIYAVILSVLLFSGCATCYNPATGREETVWTSVEQERTIGFNTAVQGLSGKIMVYDQRASEIFNRIVSAIDFPRVRKKLTVYEDYKVNAFTTGGGYIFVSSGLLTNASDDELAAVLAHEIGHDEARHVMKQVEAGMGYSAVMSIAYLMDNRKPYQKNKDWQQVAQTTNTIYQLTNLGFSRNDEFEADRLSIFYMSRAGYDPNAIISFFEKSKYLMNDMQWIYFLRSHPFLDERIAAARNIIASLETQTKTTVSVSNSPNSEAYNDFNPMGWGIERGMTREEVLAILGEPSERKENTWDIFWYYPDGRKVDFGRSDKNTDYKLTNWSRKVIPTWVQYDP